MNGEAASRSLEVIELLSDDDDDDDDDEAKATTATHAVVAAASISNKPVPAPPSVGILRNPYLVDRGNRLNENANGGRKHPLLKDDDNDDKLILAKAQQRKKRKSPTAAAVATAKPRQVGLVLEEDLARLSNASDISDIDGPSVDSYVQAQQIRLSLGKPVELFEDAAFPTLPRSIQGPKKGQTKVTCRCKGSVPAKLDYSYCKKRSNESESGGQSSNLHQLLQPIYRCAQKKCNYYSNAFQAERMHWYRLGLHTGHSIVGATAGFSANDLCQGRVGDCWFLSALAVVAERSDLILRLFGNGKFTQLNEFGICQVNLFLDGYWKTVVVDNFLPCLIDEQPGEAQLQKAIQASLGGLGGSGDGSDAGQLLCLRNTAAKKSTSSKYNPWTVSDQCRQVLRETDEFLKQHLAKNRGLLVDGNGYASNLEVTTTTPPIDRLVTSEDLAYSKAKLNQLWVPLLEKAYAKSHGSYQAISGGHIAEAFLDLTGAPTLVYNFDSRDFNPRQFWANLMRYRTQRLPMGCGTAQSQVGIIGMHAYSILDVVEVKNVSLEFFQETGVAHGNVSGFTEFDGTVRLLQIRNPHGKSEWNGDFSDHSGVWEKLLKHQVHVVQHTDEELMASKLERTMRNDGKFWIDYDSFLMGFTNVDVVLAFLGNHAKSFASNFPPKESNQRCMRAFEVSLLDTQDLPGTDSLDDTVELYVMGIQKTRRGAGHGRLDRKVSYKVCDLGILVGESHEEILHDAWGDDRIDDDTSHWRNRTFSSVSGQMFGFQRNGHYRIVLDRRRTKSLVVMPLSFGHPAATDKELSFVVRFVSDTPLLIKELPAVPRLDKVIQKYCLSKPNCLSSKQAIRSILLQGPSFRLVQTDCLGNGGGVVFLYLCVDETVLRKEGEHKDGGLSFHMEARCRGMSCRTDEGLLQHETIAKGKKFEAAWRKYNAVFNGESKSRLLAVLYQSGQDYEFGGITCRQGSHPASPNKRSTLNAFLTAEAQQMEAYLAHGIFNSVEGNGAIEASKAIRSVQHKEHLSGPISLDTYGYDLQLQQALVASLRGVELQQKMEMSKQHTSKSRNVGDLHQLAPQDASSQLYYDDDLERAIAESKAICKNSNGESMEGEDHDLKRALRLSMNDVKPPFIPTKSIPPHGELLDLTETTNESNSTIQPPKIQDTNEVDADQTEKEKASVVIEKRRLFAEAAMRRLEADK